MPFFTKKPVTIEARQFDGTWESANEIINWVYQSGSDRAVVYNIDCMIIKTLEGDHRASLGDWIIKGVKASFTLASLTFLSRPIAPPS